MKAVSPLLTLPIALPLLAGCASLLPGKNPILAPSSVVVREDTAVYRARYRAGGLRSELTLVQGRREGLTVLYFPDGSLEYTCGYRDGRAEGEALSNFPGGRRRRVEHYLRDTLLVSRTREYDSTGALISEWVPAGDTLTGFLVLRYKGRNGQIMQSTRYSRGKRNGMSFAIGSKGDTISKSFFREDKEDSASGKPILSNQRTTGSILNTIRRHTPALRRTYNEYLVRRRFGGKVTLKFRIRPDGRLDYALPIGNTTGNPRFARDIINRMQDWKFEAIAATAADDIVTVPFTFSE